MQAYRKTSRVLRLDLIGEGLLIRKIREGLELLEDTVHVVYK